MAEPIRYGHATVDEAWLDRVREPILEPDLPIIDPHHHLWHTRPTGRYMPEQLYADLYSGHDVRATVFLQCGWMHRADGPEALRPVGETEAVAAVAVLGATGAYGAARACAGIVSYTDLRDPALDAALDAHEAAGTGRFRGIRHIAAWDDTVVPTSALQTGPGLLEDDRFRAGLRRLGQRGFSFDAWVYHPQLATLVEVARAAPDTPIVLNHLGGPLGGGPYRTNREEVMRVWEAGLRALAGCPNVFVKLGGLGMPINGFDYQKQPDPPDSDRIARDWAPFVRPAIEWFGPGRCMFESNFPVDKGMVGYPVLWNAFKKLAADASPADKHALFFGTANTFYRLGLTA